MNYHAWNSTLDGTETKSLSGLSDGWSYIIVYYVNHLYGDLGMCGYWGFAVVAILVKLWDLMTPINGALHEPSIFPSRPLPVMMLL